MTFALDDALTLQLFQWLLIFVRLGAAFMFIPGIGESFVTPNARLLLALLTSIALAPVVAPQLPPIPDSPLALSLLLAGELMFGGFLGMLSRTLMSVMHTTGMIISYQSSLAAAMMFDVTQGSQGTAVGNFLTLLSVVALLALDIHHVALQGLADSYALYLPGSAMPADDMANYAVRMTGSAMLVAVQLSAPFLVLGMLLYLGAGVLSRLMPQMQVFFVLIPMQILLCFGLLAIVLSSTMLWYMEYYEQTLISFWHPDR